VGEGKEGRKNNFIALHGEEVPEAAWSCTAIQLKTS